MARVMSKQALTDSPSALLLFLPADVVSAPWAYALVCFASGLIASAALGIFLPTYADEDDVRSFVSFAVGALLCCFLLKAMPTEAAKKVGDVPSTRERLQKKVVPTPKLSSAVQHVGRHDAFPSGCGARAAPFRNASVLLTPPGLGRSSPQALKFAAPPGLEQPGRRVNLAPPRGAPPAGIPLSSRPTVSPPAQPLRYEPQSFRKEVMAIMRDLASHKNVGQAVGLVRQQNVPVDRQAAEFADILTYAVEETRGNVRRTHIAFVAGLTGVFEKAECLSGLGVFFDGVYEGLCDEVEKLPKLFKIEVLPTLNSVLPPHHVSVFVPECVKAA